MSEMYQRLKWKLLPIFRKARMARFLELMQPAPGATILDVGGLPSLNGVPGFWQDYSDKFQVTLVNLPGSFDRFSKSELAPFRLIEADICTCAGLPKKYDIVFSNSVVEHVGSRRRQGLFAAFVHSAGNSFWVQTPSPLFPLEAHCDIPFWWFIPTHLRKKKIRTWKYAGEKFLAGQMASTRPIWSSRLRLLFPESQIVTEYLLGFPKSHIVYRRCE
jgi:hypothetical protein